MSKLLVNKKWDILIILDAGRYDIFKELIQDTQIEGTLEEYHSKGTATESWRQANFNPEVDCSDINIVSGNPQLSKYKQLRDYDELVVNDIKEVWKSDWDDKLYLVRPEAVTKYAIPLIDSYEVTRFHRTLIHYLQPHFPPLNNKELQFSRGLKWSYEESKSNESIKEQDILEYGKTLWSYVGEDKVELSDVIEAYYENYRTVLKEVEQLLERINLNKYQVVISSDHGELLGLSCDNFSMGHGDNIEHENLKKVPWFKVENYIK